MCGADYPLRVSALGDGTPLSYTDAPVRPPSTIPDAALPPRWPVVQSGALPPAQPGAMTPSAPMSPPQRGPVQPGPIQQGPIPSGPAQVSPAQAGAPMSLNPPGVAEFDDDEVELQDGPSHPNYGARPPAPAQSSAPPYPPTYAPRPQAPPLGAEQPVPLGPPAAPMVTGSVELKPPATLACPIVSALDQWIAAAVQPAALHWFRQPVVEIKQISAYSCRGMNGNPNAHISEHAFGNALDVAEFLLADGHKISVQYGWHGTPEEQGFLHDVQAAACQDFTTVLAPGANAYHYNHIHVDLMRHYNGRHICEPGAIAGEVAAERARAHYAAQHNRDPGVTGSIDAKPHHHVLGYSGEDDDRLPDAVPGDD
jgi:hypothetical protein